MANEIDNSLPIVVDNGSKSIKAGFAGDNAPSSVFDTIIGHPARPCPFMKLKDTYIGYEASSKRGLCVLKYPIECGIIYNWDAMEKIWHHTFYNELRVSPESHPVLLTECPFNPKNNREKTAEIMFETFHVPSMYLAVQSVLSLYDSGHTTGLVIDCGEHLGYTVPIYEGQAVQQAISRLDVGWWRLTEYINVHFIRGRYCEFLGPKYRPVIEDYIMELGYVALDFDKELELAKNRPTTEEEISLNHELLTYDSERFRCPEALFQPSFVRSNSSGIHKLAHDSIMKCDEDIRKSMYNTIVLSGGLTMFPGFANRVRKEVSALATEGTEVKVIAPEERNYSAWRGGSKLASLDTFKQLSISRFEYEEYGPAIVNKKCF